MVAKYTAFVTGEMGAYSRAKKKNGKQTPQTAARPKALPFSDPHDMYLQMEMVIVYPNIYIVHTTSLNPSIHQRMCSEDGMRVRILYHHGNAQG